MWWRLVEWLRSAALITFCVVKSLTVDACCYSLQEPPVEPEKLIRSQFLAMLDFILGGGGLNIWKGPTKELIQPSVHEKWIRNTSCSF